MQVLESLGKAYDFDLTTPWQDLAGGVQQIILYGSGGMPVELTFKDGRRTYTTHKALEGVNGNINRRLDRKSVVLGKSVSVRVDLGGRRIIKKTKPSN